MDAEFACLSHRHLKREHRMRAILALQWPDLNLDLAKDWHLGLILRLQVALDVA